MIEIPLEMIRNNPWQTREGLDNAHIQLLAQDIQRNGLLQAPTGRMVMADGKVKLLGIDPDELEFLQKEGTYCQLAFGHNRLAAVRALGWGSMPVELRPLSDEEMALMAWSENSARKDLTAIEEASAIQRDMQAFGWTQEQAGEKLGLARATVANKLRLLKLPEEVQSALASGKISERQASALLPLVEMPAEVKGYLDKNLQAYETKPKEIIERVVAGGKNLLSSDDIRETVERLQRRACKELNQASFLKHEFTGTEFQSASCMNCAWRIKDRNQCSRPDCFDRKELAWEEIEAAEAVRISGLPFFKVKYTTRSEIKEFYTTENDEKAAAAEIYRKGCKNLVVHKGYGFKPEGMPEEFSIGCHHGEGGKCTCWAKELANFRRSDPNHRTEKENKQKVEELKSQVRELMGAELLAGNLEVWRETEHSYDAAENAKIQEMTLEQLAAKRFSGTVERWIGWSYEKDKPELIQKKLEEKLAGLGLRAPWMPKTLVEVFAEEEKA